MMQYQAYKESGIEWLDEVPEHWKVGKLKYAASVRGRIGFRGYTKEDLVDEGDGALSIGASHIGDTGSLNLSKPVYLSWEKYYESPEIMLELGDILIVQRGSCGRVGVVDRNIGPATINPSMIVLKESTIHHNYLFHFLNSSYTQNYFNMLISSTAVPMISQEQVNNLSIIYPKSYAEQHLIRNYLNHKTHLLDTLIEKKQKQIDLLKEQRAAIINQAVTKGLNPNVKMKDSGIEWLGEVPEHWETVPFRWYFKIGSGEFLSNLEIEGKKDNESSVPVIGGNGIMGYSTKFNVREATIAIGRVGAHCGNVHIVNPPAWITDNALRLSGIRGYRLEFLFLLLSTMDLNRLANQNAQPLITGAMIKSQRAVLPPLAEQDSITNYCSDIIKKVDKTILKNHELINNYTEYRTTLISNVVTGKIDVRDEVIP